MCVALNLKHLEHLALGTTAASGAYSAYSNIQEGKQTSKMYQYQAGQLEKQKQIVQQRADINSQLNQYAASEQGAKLMKEYQVTAGTQKAALAAQGIGGGSVTAEDIASSTFDKAKLDQVALKYNADLKSYEIQEEAKNDIYGLNVQQSYLNAMAKNARTASKSKAFGTLLGTAASMAQIGLLAKKT